jgi:hypothetical protein
MKIIYKRKFTFLFVFFFPWHCCQTRATAASFMTFLDHTHDTPQSVKLLCTSNQPVAEPSTWQHTTLARDRYPRHSRDSNPQSQQAIGRAPTPRGHWHRTALFIYSTIFAWRWILRLKCAANFKSRHCFCAEQTIVWTELFSYTLSCKTTALCCLLKWGKIKFQNFYFIPETKVSWLHLTSVSVVPQAR